VRELTYFPLLASYPKTSGYGYRTNPVTGAQESFHRGCDYGAPDGAELVAPYDGWVSTGNEAGGAGLWLWVVNGPDMFKSFHHSRFEVTSGWVTAGTCLAYIDSTGSSTGSHAHLELWDGGINIDPTGYLDRAPLRDGGNHETEGDEMTDDDWNQMASLLNTMLLGKFAMHTTPNVLMCDDQGQFIVVMVDGHPHRYILGPDEASLASKVGMLVPQKPMTPPQSCPSAYHVNNLTTGERNILYSYPTV
jgi:hypothetical protein